MSERRLKKGGEKMNPEVVSEKVSKTECLRTCLNNLDESLQAINDFLVIKQVPDDALSGEETIIDCLISKVTVCEQRAQTIYNEIQKLL